MDFAEFIATNNDAGKRFDRIARRVVSTENLSSIYKQIRKGFIKLNGKKTAPETRVASGDVIAVAKFLLPDSDAHFKNVTHSSESAFPYKIIFQNDALLAIDKPYDISVQPAKIGETSIAQTVVDFSKSDSLSFTCAPLHRLDRRTTGLLVCSQNIDGARWFSEQIALHKIKKTYLAIVEGIVEKTETWQDEILAGDANARGDEKKFHTVTVAPTIVNKSALANALAPVANASTKRAVTKASPIAHGTSENMTATLMAFEIETGRKHQIRAQSASHGHPLLGDTSYGAKELPKKFGQKLFLHAWKIYFPPNELEIPNELICPPPQKFKKILSQLLIEFD